MEDRIITLLDENDKEQEFEIIASMTIENVEYAILVPTDEDGEEGFVFKIVEDNGEEILQVVDNDEELAKVSKAYEEMVDAEDEE